MTTLAGKSSLLLRSGNALPQRVRNKVDSWMDRLSAPGSLTGVRTNAELREALAEIGVPAEPLTDVAILSLEQSLATRLEQLAEKTPPFGIFHNGTATLGRICYAVCRALRPQVVVETGVAYGVTSAYVLYALAENGEGELHSIDLPPLGPDAERHVGYLIPRELRGRWTLHIGSARKLLPEVFRRVSGADLFIHDSLHTYAHMKMEFAAALAQLRPGGVLIADDVEGNRAFEETVRDPRVASWFAIREKGKDAICGAIRMKDR
jgi:predicted O-methyltransferase YrrM